MASNLLAMASNLMAMAVKVCKGTFRRTLLSQDDLVFSEISGGTPPTRRPCDDADRFPSKYFAQMRTLDVSR